MKITPAHDPNDFEVGNRHNLERIVIMNDDATMNENCPLKYQGMTREDARKELLSDLKEQDLLLEIEPLNHEVGHSERTGVMIEPMIKKQWFVKMRKLADNVLENQKNKDTKVNFVPEYYEKTMNHWMEITYDWCISRQLWWGHRIPAWYKDEEVYVGMEAPKEPGWVQDEDVLDTWFSSALWPFSTLGWPEKNADIERYFPNDCLVTGYDIIPFWVNRMTFQSLELNNVRPFKDCIIHGLIRDKDGRKMSKSLGNGVDPFDMVEKYGVDALRFYLTTDCALGTDLRFDETKMSSTWNFINKLWNASRFVLMNIEDIKDTTYENLSISDKWILTKMNKLIDNITKHMEKYEFNIVGSELYSFIWNDFCDWYIELSKSDMSNTNKSVLLLVLTNILKMLHPFMPFVTEEIYMMLPIKDSDSIMISNYPTVNNYKFNDEKETMDKIIEDIVSIRNLKATNNITKNAYINYEIDGIYKDIYVKQLKLDKHEYVEDSNLPNINYKSKYITINYYEQKENNNESNLEEINKLKASIERREKLLSNENYINKAPANIVEMDRKKLEEEKEKLAILENK